ncbi:MAG: response regulator [Prevotellaceae bacterium]|nr:response regulator [Candidatus Minthosoma caballi]
MNQYIHEGIDVNSLSVLIVDDVPLNVLLIKKMLTKYTFEVRTATNGKLALDAVAAKKPDLILLDLLMPIMDGFEVITHLRENNDTKEIPIIVLSALNSEEDITRAFRLGANDFINKPVIMEKLIASVTQQINLHEAMKKMG